MNYNVSLPDSTFVVAHEYTGTGDLDIPPPRSRSSSIASYRNRSRLFSDDLDGVGSSYRSRSRFFSDDLNDT